MKVTTQKYLSSIFCQGHTTNKILKLKCKKKKNNTYQHQTETGWLNCNFDRIN